MIKLKGGFFPPLLILKIALYVGYWSILEHVLSTPQTKLQNQ